MILLIDNYDSFVHNLARYFERLGQKTIVVRNDAVNAGRIREMQPAAIVLSPGPCTPHEAGMSIDLVQELYQEIPMLGVCLGHQTLAVALGGRTIRAQEPVHGRTSLVEHYERGVFEGVPNPLKVCRYHSLVVEETSLPREFKVTARTIDDGIVMAIAHRVYPMVGLQFHPESILTDCGYELLTGFLRLAGIEVAGDPPKTMQEFAIGAVIR